MALVAPASKITIDYGQSVQSVYLDALMGMIREYWDMKHDTPAHGYHLMRYKWNFDEGKLASWKLAQAMGSTDLEKFGLRSFINSVWERVRRHEITSTSAGQEVDVEPYCITSLGFEPEPQRLSDHSSSEYETASAVSRRWWYEFERQRYYHDCKKCLGDWRLQEYTESHVGVRVYSS
jgi:hypothetical protein